MSLNLRTLLKRDGLFMHCFITAVALGWVYLVISDYFPPHVTPFRHGLHLMEAICTSFLAVLGWAGPRRHKPLETSDSQETTAALYNDEAKQ